MIGNIRAVFSEILGEADWMDERTKSLAKEKVTLISDTLLVLSNIPYLP